MWFSMTWWKIYTGHFMFVVTLFMMERHPLNDWNCVSAPKCDLYMYLY